MKLSRAGDRALQLLLFNEECLVGTSHQLVPITSLPFVHTARRYYRLNGHSKHMGRVMVMLATTDFDPNYGKLGYLEEVKVVTRFP